MASSSSNYEVIHDLKNMEFYIPLGEGKLIVIFHILNHYMEASEPYPARNFWWEIRI